MFSVNVFRWGGRGGGGVFAACALAITCPPQRGYAKLVIVENVLTNTDLADKYRMIDVF